MKAILVFVWSLMAAAVVVPAAAAPFDSDAGFRPYMQNQPQRPLPPQPAPQREADRAPPRPPGEGDRGRMSPDERRQLRRDIQDAGKDIYHRDRPAPRREQRR